MFKEFSAKKVDDAIKQGLAELGLTLDDVTVEVLDAGGFLRKAKVRLTVDEKDPAPVAETEDVKPDKKLGKDEKVEKVEKTEKDGKNVADKPAGKQPDKARKPEVKADKPIKTDKAEKTEKVDHVEKAENAETEKKPRRLKAEDKDALDKARAFIADVTALMGFEVNVTLSGDGETVNIDAPDRDDSLIIGRHGETLSALSYLAETCIRAEKCHTSVTVDCNGYRGRRAASLSSMARRKADECVRRRRKIKLEPMDRTDRRTVHSALNDDGRVTTASEGKEPYRCVVILPAGKDKKRGDRAERVEETIDEE